MLTENDIVNIMREYLPRQGYTIGQFCTTDEKGIDIVALHATHKLYIEVKGETSSKEWSARFGLAFDDGQIKTHVSVAILQTMVVLQNKPAGSKTKVGIALPDTPGHREVISSVINPIKTLGIKMFWVSHDGVTIQP